MDTYSYLTTITLLDPIKSNSEFVGWQIVKGDSILNDNTLIIGTSETILYAMWESRVSLTVNLGGGTSSQSFNSAYESGTILTLETPTKEGHTFLGWEVTSGNSIVSGNSFTMGSEDTVIKAKWGINTYTVTTRYIYYYLNTTWIQYDTRTDSATYGSSFSPYNIAAPIGYYAANYYSYLDSSDNYIGSGTIGSDSFTVTKDTFVNVHYYPNTYTITYNLNGGTNGSSAPTSGIYGSTVTVSNPIREGYTFTGWTASGTGASLSGTNLTIGASNITLTANWRAQSLILAYSCANESIGTSPNFTYTGNCAVIDDGNNNWRVKFLTSGTLTFHNLINASNGIDVFLVGGGGSGGSGIVIIRNAR